MWSEWCVSIKTLRPCHSCDKKVVFFLIKSGSDHRELPFYPYQDPFAFDMKYYYHENASNFTNARREEFFDKGRLSNKSVACNFGKNTHTINFRKIPVLIFSMKNITSRPAQCWIVPQFSEIYVQSCLKINGKDLVQIPFWKGGLKRMDSPTS